MADPVAHNFWAELATNDGLLVEIEGDGVVRGASPCPHRRIERVITSSSDLDALITATAFCAVPDCLARLHARAVLAQLAAVGAGR